jgi:4-hydroxy-3-methylbut-2-enyl diphosphate reductase
MRLEALAVRHSSLVIMQSGYGRRAAAAARARVGDRPVLVAGLAGALAPGLRPGDVVVADSVLDDVTGHVQRLPAGPLLAEQVSQVVPRVRTGPVLSTSRLVDGARRAELARTGALVVDLESAELVRGRDDAAVLRVVTDTADEPLWRLSTPARLVRGLRVLNACVPAIDQWADHRRPTPTSPEEVTDR